MPRSEYHRASFMMFCRGDFSSKLCIPTKFMLKYRQAVQHSAILETEYSPTSWDVKIKNLNSDFYMTDGWPEFVKDNQLGERDFLTFRLMAESTFKVSIYRGDGCPKHLITSPMSSRRRVVDENESGIRRAGRPRKRKGGAQFKEGNPLYFEICLTPYNKARFNLPQKFSNAANMKVKKQVMVEYVGKGYGVAVAVDPRPENYRVDLGKGWPEFRVANGLEPGNMCSFEFNPDKDVIYVKEV